MQIKNGMYGIPQSGKISNDKLKLHLENFGHKPETITPGLWRHQKRPLQFSRVVDDFGVQYEPQADITHLIDTLKIIYIIYEDWNGKLYCGLIL